VRNDQRTATATADATFEIGRNIATVCDQALCTTEGPGPRDTDNKVPGPAFALVGLALLGLAVALRRRKA
jgi:hypothetical protein